MTATHIGACWRCRHAETAALALTRHGARRTTAGCALRAANLALATDRVETDKLPGVLKNRLRLRKAGVWASLAYQRARRPELGAPAVQQAGQRALDELAGIDQSELMEADAYAYSDAAMRVGASRWATEAGAPAAKLQKVSVVLSPGQPGETCVHLVDAKHDAQNPLLTRCTYGIVWTASAAPQSPRAALALAVQPLDTCASCGCSAVDRRAGAWILPLAADHPASAMSNSPAGAGRQTVARAREAARKAATNELRRCAACRRWKWKAGRQAEQPEQLLSLAGPA